MDKKQKTDPMALGIPNICFSFAKTLKDPEYLEILKQQRIENGFDETELWDLPSTITKFTLPRLKAYRRACEEIKGHPADIDSVEEWLNIQDRIIKAMEDEVEGNMPEAGKIKEGFELFFKYFFYFWC